jgi:adenine-specific DNA-methyltransferase
VPLCAAGEDRGVMTKFDLRDIETWREQLGLLPVPLFGESSPEASYVLLNGARGNFCLDLSEQRPDVESRNRAWSSNVGHYVTFVGSDVYAQRWDWPASQVHRFPASEVLLDFDRFHRFLENDLPSTELSIIAHSLQCFRRLRAVLGKTVDSAQALSTFLYMLAATIDDIERMDLSLSRWQLNAESRDLALSIQAESWQSLLADLTGGRPIEGLKPDLRLVLRHASGVLFQEAHYAAVFDVSGQLWLQGFTPSPVDIKPETAAIGLHFTPPALARTLVEESLGPLQGTLRERVVIFDPACGSGEFLREALRQLTLQSYSGKVHLVGFDFSEAACQMARFTLAWEMRDIAERVSVDIVCCDALASEVEWPASVDLLLMNPPFRSWRDLTSSQQQTVKRVLGELARMRPDLSTAFLWRAVGSLGPRSVMGCLLPSSFLDGTSFRAVRAELGSRLTPCLVARLGSHDLFQDARIDTSLYIAGKGIESHGPLAMSVDHRASSTSAALRSLRRRRVIESWTDTPILGDGFSIYVNPDTGTGIGSWAPRPFREWTLLRRYIANKGVRRVSDLFAVKQGTITGLNRVLLLAKSDWLNLPTDERAFFRPCALNESILDGQLLQESYIFYPHGQHAIDTEDQLQRVVPHFYSESLCPNKEGLRGRRRIKRDHWWVLSEHRAWQVKPTRKILSTYFGDTGSFALDMGGDCVVVQGYGWLPRRDTSHKIWLAYLAIINSRVFSSLLAAGSNHVGGGQWNLSKRYVEPLPLPDLHGGALDPGLLALLYDLGKRIHEDSLASLTREDDLRLSEIVDAAYGGSDG